MTLGNVTEAELGLPAKIVMYNRRVYNRNIRIQRTQKHKLIIIYHNEPYSALVRTLWSVVNSVRRDQPWYTHANYIDRETGRNTCLALGLFQQLLGRIVQKDSVKSDYEHQVLQDEARIVPGLGEGGGIPELNDEEKKLGAKSEKKFAMNVFLSERISYNRTLRDYRNPACAQVLYDAELPSVSVIIIYHNEPYSALVRTLWSVVNSVRRDQPWYTHANYIDRETGRNTCLGYPGQDPSSQLVYIREIILVDDNSTLPELKGKLSYYVRTRLPPDLIKILRLPSRVGVTQARLAGARHANGEVLLFLDAHCETQPDWLRPLLQRVKESPHSVVVPIIDVIESSNFCYVIKNLVSFEVGGFMFSGDYIWIEVPAHEKKRRGSDIAPTRSPTMAGGLFAMDREYFWELGAYDDQMIGWGGENLEISFRIWQCGGTLETIPCSRVGHVFRNFHPYEPRRHIDSHGINTARLVKVWMDDYAEIFYMYRPDLREDHKISNVTLRRLLREKLKCKTFQWYLDNIYPEKFIPVRDSYGYGRFSNVATGFCLDTLQRDEDVAPLGVYPCHRLLYESQYFSLSFAGELRTEQRCAVVQEKRSQKRRRDEGQLLLMVECNGQQRKLWRHLSSGHLLHEQTQLCLDAGKRPGANVRVKRCYQNKHNQKWRFDYDVDNNFRMNGDTEPSEQELKLLSLRNRNNQLP